MMMMMLRSVVRRCDECTCCASKLPPDQNCASHNRKQTFSSPADWPQQRRIFKKEENSQSSLEFLEKLQSCQILKSLWNDKLCQLICNSNQKIKLSLSLLISHSELKSPLPLCPLDETAPFSDFAFSHHCPIVGRFFIQRIVCNSTSFSWPFQLGN